MHDIELGFPAYRKYKGVNVWFMIVSDKTFVEIKQVGNQFVKQEVTALQYPEMVFIQDMLNCHEQRWEIIPKSVFDNAQKNVDL